MHSDPQSVLFDALHIFGKAQITPFDKAEVVIVADTSRSLYKAMMLLAFGIFLSHEWMKKMGRSGNAFWCQEARKRGQQVAPPKWLERCLQIRCALQIAGDLEESGEGTRAASRHVMFCLHVAMVIDKRK